MDYKPGLPPRFNIEDIMQFLNDEFNLSVKVHPLVSDIGQNFLLADQTGKKYILKIANPSESETMLDAQNSILKHLNKQILEFQFPQVLLSTSSSEITQITDKAGRQFNSRLLTYLPGKFLATVETVDDHLLKSIGQLLGKLDKTISDFDHPAIHRYWHWDLKNISVIRQFLHPISNSEKRRIASYFLLQFETEVLSQLDTLRQSPIHNDANDHNILIDPDTGRASGLIDFGDMVYSCTIFELAVALAYIMMDNEDPLQAAVPVIQGYHDKFPLLENEIDILYQTICARLCLSVTMSAYQRQIQQENEYLSVSEDFAWKLLFQMIEINPQKAQAVFRQACEIAHPDQAGLDIPSIVNNRKKLIGPSLSISYQQPLKIIRGALQYLYDESGETYLDCVNNVCHVGHAHPDVVRVAQKQMAVLNTNTRYLHDHIIEYARRLTATLPDPLNVCFFVNSGSEANELALRLAYTYTGNKDLIILDNAYHGNTSSLIDISPYKYDHPGGSGPGSHTHKADMPDIYRGEFKESNPLAGKKYAEAVIKIIGNLQNDHKGLAGFMCESLLGCGGQIILPEGYLKEVYPAVRSAGGVYIIDEVQVGFGRVGSHFWGFELQGVVPDIVTMGKPIGNGHPLAAVVCTPEIANAFDNGMEYFNTFGGNPVSCATGLAVLDVIRDEKLQENALTVGALMMEGFNELKEYHPLIGDVRGAGLFIGIELVTDRETLEPATKQAKQIIEMMKERGILLSTDGPFDNVIKIKPPIVFNEANARRVVNALDKVLSNLKR